MSNLPPTYRAWRRTVGKEPLSIELTTEKTPKPENLGSHEVLIKIHAVSLNYRDVAMLHGKYIKPVEEHGIASSDCAAEVIAVGPEVTDFRNGDTVSAVYDLNNKNADDKGDLAALGGEKPGVLREYAVFGDDVLVHLPKHLSWEEGSLLTCAGLTAWTSLRLPGSASSGNSALLQGTGGVSMFALILCLAAGIYPIITSSSDEKLNNVRKLASGQRIGTINYKTQDIKSEVLRLTEGRGVDIVVNNIGAASINEDVAVLRRRGVISCVGFLAGSKADLDPGLITQIIIKCAYIIGIYVGSIVEFREMNKFLDGNKLQLNDLIDRVFSFEETKEAFDYLYSGAHVGKVVIKF